jgi:hypothetical protein
MSMLSPHIRRNLFLLFKNTNQLMQDRTHV